MANHIFSSLSSSVFGMAVLLASMCAHEKVHAAHPAPVRLSDHIPTKALSKARCLGRFDADTHIPLTFTLPLRNRAELEDLINRLYDPADPMYKKYLSSSEFVERFAPTQEDYDRVIAYAQSVGLEVVAKHPNRILLNVKGHQKSIENALRLRLHRYQLPNGRTFFAPNKNPAVPSSIASTIGGVVGLHNHAVWKTYNHKKEMAATSRDSSRTFPSGPNGGLAPNDIGTAYNLISVGVNGAGQKIALLQLASYLPSDIDEYARAFGLPSPKLINIAVDGGSASGIDAEVVIDIELALALAPQSEIYVYEGPNSNQGVLDTYNRIATDNIAKQVSTSWGLGEDLSDPQDLQSQNAIFMQMAAQGQTMYAAAGDSGAFDDYDQNRSTSLVVDDPASQPYVIGVGGTRLSVDAKSGAYKTETVWNDGLGNGAGGGGVSTVWPIPTWQTNVSTASSKTHRNVPDVALNADAEIGYAIYYNGQWTIYGGTSCAAPLWASFTACINQALATAHMPVLGFANPALYTIGTGALYTSDFHDVTTGDNLHYKALVGYDNASGWGSFNGANLLANLTQAATYLGVVMKHHAPFVRGENGAYHIIVSNPGQGGISGPVSVNVNLPIGLSYQSFSGSGWSFDQKTLTFTQNSTLMSGSSYPTLVVNVDVAENAASTVIAQATVLRGSSVETQTSDLTTVRP